MATLGLTLQPGTLDNVSCYPATPQALYAEMFAKGRALLGSITGIIISATAPAAEFRDRGWLKVDGGQVLGIFAWSTTLNAWVFPNAEPANPNSVANIGVIRWWRGAAADVGTYDGGEAGIVSAISGPMWEIDTEMSGRVPLTPGTLTSGAVVAVNDTGGSDEVTLAIANIPPHVHTVPLPQNTTADGSNGQYLISSNSGTQDTGSTGGSGTPPVTQPFTTMPPYIGVYAIKRTARIYYRG